MSCWGSRWRGRRRFARWPRFSVEDIHRFGGLLVGSFVAIHIVTVAIDSWLPFSLSSLIVPFTTKYRPLWVGLGVAAAELLLALAVTNHYRRRLPYTVWRRAHYLNFAVWARRPLHGIGSGTDRSSPWLLAVFAVAVASVCAAIAWRARPHRSRARRRVRSPASPALPRPAVVALGPARSSSSRSPGTPPASARRSRATSPSSAA